MDNTQSQNLSVSVALIKINEVYTGVMKKTGFLGLREEKSWEYNLEQIIQDITRVKNQTVDLTWLKIAIQSKVDHCEQSIKGSERYLARISVLLVIIGFLIQIDLAVQGIEKFLVVMFLFLTVPVIGLIYTKASEAIKLTFYKTVRNILNMDEENI